MNYWFPLCLTLCSECLQWGCTSVVMMLGGFPGRAWKEQLRHLVPWSGEETQGLSGWGQFQHGAAYLKNICLVWSHTLLWCSLLTSDTTTPSPLEGLWLEAEWNIPTEAKGWRITPPADQQRRGCGTALRQEVQKTGNENSTVVWDGAPETTSERRVCL